MENEILNKMLKKIEKDKFIIETPEDEFIFDIKNFNEEDLRRIFKQLDKNYEKGMQSLVSAILKKRDGTSLSSALVSQIVNLKIPTAHNIIFGIMAVIVKKFT